MLKKIIFFLGFVIIGFNLSAQLSEKTIYLIPGQGSDYRIYKYFTFEDFDTVHIKYTVPVENESMEHYAKSLTDQIDKTKRFSIIGVSLGGMLAVEMSEFLKPEEVIIISSAKNRNELPARYKFMKQVPINKAFGGGFIRSAAPSAQLIVEPDSKQERELCVSMLKGKNEIFMKRSVNMIINWKRISCRTKTIHIHGDNDHTIPLRNIKDVDYIIENGSHMMTLIRGKEICNIVKTHIKH